MSDKQNIHPFAPTVTASREQLQAYVEGRSTPSEQHAIEVQLENDPFLRDALEGLQEPGAFAEFDQLVPPSIPTQRTGSLWVVAATIAVITGSVVAFSVTQEVSSGKNSTVAVVPSQGEPKNDVEPQLIAELEPLPPAEIAASVQLAETLQIGHQMNDLHAKAMEHVVDTREPIILDSMVAVDPVLKLDRVPDKPEPVRAKKASLQLIYLHDLKLVDPKELYTRMAMLDVSEQGVDASFSDADAKNAAKQNQRMMPYTPYMDAAMGKFVRNDHKGCLLDLQRVIDQYPDDVNALFYSGLCCYNLGLYQRAKRFLSRAATHTINVFDEEADWYHALTLKHTGEGEAARSSFLRIAEQNGFYADRARKELGHR